MHRELAVDAPRSIAVRARRSRGRARLVTAALWAVAAGNLGAVVWLWIGAGNLDSGDAGDVLTAIGRLTGLVSAYLALVQVLLLARVPAVERLAGFDRLSVWHRRNGHACLYFLLAHVVFTLVGYALLDRLSLPSELTTMIRSLPGMIVAWVGTGLLVAVVVSSIAIARRRLSYERWHALHLLSYAGIALGWFHQIPTGNELVLNTVAADWWRALYAATLALVVWYRLLAPLVNAVRFRMRVTDVRFDNPGVVSVTIAGRGLQRLGSRPGQFFLWRFLAPGVWWESHPFSLSAAPRDGSIRITIKALGDFTRRVGALPVGTRVVAEGPLGTFTADAARTDRLLMIGGGVGITPIRAMLDDLHGDVVVIYRALHDGDLVLRDEIERIAAERGFALHLVVGDHWTDEGRRFLSPEHLRELVPDVAEREVFLCGPPLLADLVRDSLRTVGVPSRLIHIERFAL